MSESDEIIDASCLKTLKIKDIKSEKFLLFVWKYLNHMTKSKIRIREVVRVNQICFDFVWVILILFTFYHIVLSLFQFFFNANILHLASSSKGNCQ